MCIGQQGWVPSGQPAAPVSLFLISLHLSQSTSTQILYFKGTLSEMHTCGVGRGETISRFHVPAIKASDAEENLLLSRAGDTTSAHHKKLRNALHPLLYSPVQGKENMDLKKCKSQKDYSWRYEFRHQPAFSSQKMFFFPSKTGCEASSGF